MKTAKGILVVLLVFLLVLATIGLMLGMSGGIAGEPEQAPEFTVMDSDGKEIRPSDYRGEVLLLHFTQLENPLCLECEAHMIGQVAELQQAWEMSGGELNIVTLNIRKNPYSEAGEAMAENYYGLSINWSWVEEFEPYPASSNYLKYWELDGAMSNPTLVFVDQNGFVVGSYRVYTMGKGEVDGVRSAESLLDDAEAIASGEWGDDFRGTISGARLTLGSMFLLGILTSFTPCSIALLLAMISYIGSMPDERHHTRTISRLTIGIKIGLSFTLGMALIFFLIGLLVAYLGDFVQASPLFYLLTGALLVFLGLWSLFPLSEALTGWWRRMWGEGAATGEKISHAGRLGIQKIGSRSKNLAAFLLGVLFTIGWAPCALTLVFPVIVLLLTQQVPLLTGGILMLAFGLGHGLVVVPFCAATGELKGRLGKGYVSAGTWIKWGFGLAIIFIGLIFVLRYFGLRLW